MGIIVNEFCKPIKHIKPVNHRRLRKHVKSLRIDFKKAVVQVYANNKYMVCADVYLFENNILTYKASILDYKY